jgi:beta-glucosidase-like glycosyl hydrolase
MSLTFNFRFRALAAGYILVLASTAGGAEKKIQPPYQDPKAAVEQRVEDLLGRMTLEEKVGQLNWPCVYVSELGNDIPTKMESCRRFAAGNFVRGLGPGGGFFTLANTILHEGPVQQARFFNELQRIAMEQTRLGIPLMQVEEGTHGLMCSGGTVFPEGPGLGSSWDMELFRRVYAAAAGEARSVGIHQLFTLVVEPNRDPRLGRNQEAYSECPFLTAAIAEAIVYGAQGDDISAPDKVVAGLCHYPGQSQPVSGMEQGAMEISERVLREVFLPSWEAGIIKSGALGVMATYPEIDGVPAHASEFIMTGILRDELGFEGVVLSEGNGFETLITRKVAADQKQAGALALQAGVDVGITYEPAFMLPLIENVREGTVPEALIDRAVRRVLELKFRLGLFEEPYVNPERAARVSHAQEHQALALEAARQSIVLLKNEDDLLPLNKDLKKIAVIGPNADDPRNQLGDYTSDVILQDIVTVLDGIREMVPPSTEIEYVKGCEVVGGGREEFDEAVRAAAAAHAAIVVLGENERFKAGGLGTNGEHKDAATLELTGLQEEMLRRVAATGTPLVLVLINGRPLAIRWAAENVPAILEAWLPGEKGGQAVAEVLFGEHNPSGRLPVTVPRHAGQLPVYYNFKPSKAFSIRRTGYVDLPVTPLWEFGFGLSYTDFEYTDLRIEPEQASIADQVKVSLRVRNTGHVPGKEVVQLYLRDEISSVVTAVKQLRGFRKIELGPGEQKTIEFVLSPGDFSLLDKKLSRVVEPGSFEIMVGASSEDIRLRELLEVIER